MSGTATASMQGILDRTRESSRPFVYPLNMHAQLSVKIGDRHASKDQCKALTGALGIMANTPFRFSKNTGDSLYACCVNKDTGCRWQYNFFAKKVAQDANANRQWTVTKLCAQHQPGCDASTFQTHPTLPPYGHSLLAHVLLGCVNHPGQKVPLQTIRHTLAGYLPWHVTDVYCSKLKSAAERLLLATTAIPKEVSPSKTAHYQTALLMDYVTKLRECGHHVSLTTQTGATLQQFIMDSASKAHAARMKKRATCDRFSFDPTRVYNDDFYQSIDPDGLHMHTVMICPSTAQHLLKTCRRVSQADFAHCKGWIGGNFFNRVTMDANHGTVHLVLGYVVGNENKESWTVANTFTKDSLPGYDVYGQVDICDASKGGIEARAVWEHVVGFVCSNHHTDNAKKISVAAGVQYAQAVHATTMVELEMTMADFGASLQKFVARQPIISQFPVALLEQTGIHLHGVTTSNSSESINNAAKIARLANSEYVLVKLCIEMAFRHFFERTDDMEKWSTKLSCPPRILARLQALNDEVLMRRTTERIQPLGNKTYTLLGDYLSTGTVHVDLGARSLSTMCCAGAHVHQKPCIHIVGCLAHAKRDTTNFHGIDILHPSDTNKAWISQYGTRTSMTTMKLPSNAGNPVDVLALTMAKTRVQLTSKSEFVCVSSAPVIPLPPGRPTKKRQQAYSLNPKNARICSVCGHPVLGHNRTTCRGRSELPVSITHDISGTTTATPTPTAVSVPNVIAFEYEKQDEYWCLKHALNNLFAIAWVTKEMLVEIFKARPPPKLSEESGHTYPGFSVGTALEAIKTTGHGVKEKPAGRSAQLLSSSLQPGTQWANIVGTVGILIAYASHFTCIATVSLHPNMHWRHINSLPPYSQDFHTKEELNAFLDKASNKDETTTIIQIVPVRYPKQRVGVHWTSGSGRGTPDHIGVVTAGFDPGCDQPVDKATLAAIASGAAQEPRLVEEPSDMSAEDAAAMNVAAVAAAVDAIDAVAAVDAGEEAEEATMESINLDEAEVTTSSVNKRNRDEDGTSKDDCATKYPKVDHDNELEQVPLRQPRASSDSNELQAAKAANFKDDWVACVTNAAHQMNRSHTNLKKYVSDNMIDFTIDVLGMEAMETLMSQARLQLKKKIVEDGLRKSKSSESVLATKTNQGLLQAALSALASSWKLDE
jgi:hypothetical protein